MFSRKLAKAVPMSVPARNFGANEKILKMRIMAVSNIGKITKAMKMVSASKMRGELANLEAGRNYGFNSIDMIFKSDTYLQRKAPVEAAEPKEILVPITTEKGLCGGTNSSIIREVKTYVGARKRENCKIICVGEKGAAALTRPFADIFTIGMSQFQLPYNYPTIMAVADTIGTNGENYDKIVIFYNEFKSALVQEVRKMELIPRKKFLETMKYGHLYQQKLPDKSTANPALYDLYLTSNLWVAILNNSASEQSSRMNAMENASKNAGEIVERLNLKYNQARQARITMELVEIISGASAL